MRGLLLLATLFVAVGCQLAPGGSGTAVIARLPPVIGGLTIPYHENAVADLEGQREFFDGAAAAVGGDPKTARVAIGTGPGGLTLRSQGTLSTQTGRDPLRGGRLPGAR